MPLSVHKIERYAVQVLNQRHGGKPQNSIVVRLYDDQGIDRGNAVFKDYSGTTAETPIADAQADRATVFYDLGFFDAFIGILRNEDEVYWKLALTQLGANRTVSDASLDSKKDIVGEFFPRQVK